MREGARLFGNMTSNHLMNFRTTGEVIRSTRVVRLTTHKLMKDGYLEYSESAHPREDRYAPTQKLIDLWAEIQQEKEQQQS
jgi:hypothetical protein